VDKWPPLRPFRAPDQCHVRFVRQAISFSRVAGDARANHVLPRRQSAPIPRQDVIEIQVGPLKNSAAILAGVLVPLENVVPGELHFLLGQPIEQEQNNHPRHPDLPGNGGDDFVVGRGRGKIAPAIEVVGEKIIGRIGGNDLGVSLVEEREGAAGRADVDRLPEAIEHQDLTI